MLTLSTDTLLDTAITTLLFPQPSPAVFPDPPLSLSSLNPTPNPSLGPAACFSDESLPRAPSSRSRAADAASIAAAVREYDPAACCCCFDGDLFFLDFEGSAEAFDLGVDGVLRVCFLEGEPTPPGVRPPLLLGLPPLPP